MKYIKQFMIILFFSFIGELLNYYIPLPVPASIYGIILLFIALETGIVKYEAVKDTGKFLIEIMPLMFIPAAVGLIDSWSLIAGNWLAYAVITFVTTVVVMGVSALVTQTVIRSGRRGKENE